ncbi:MAG: hydrolase [Bacteroidetes bacterium RIFCSPLOWO2_02_FULL_36_8]|nr:MAG: hydrolase [Bacteroidetes bacterium RIFCSPLOWO2_02_FULL_36_8]OFY70608.1 MAG: hydrolase [Bacteroidetes bacterium RIFCSPLOWO2_12_FULL_37_12]
MQITFLGTGTSQGVPVIACDCKICRSIDYRDKRLRSSIHIQHKNTSVIIDSGPDFRQQVLRERINKLDALIFTHAHKDHTAGMDDVRGFNFSQDKAVPVYGTLEVLNQIKQEFEYVFNNSKYPGIPKIDLVEIDNKPFTVGDITLIPILVKHHKMPVFGFRVGDFTYITDANFIPEEEMKKIYGSKIIVLNALRKEKHISHYTLEEAVEVLKILKPERAYLTHISHQLGLHEEVEKELPEFVRLGYDGLRVDA